jgi:hypothetical protein
VPVIIYPHGNPVEIVVPAGILGTAGGRVLSLNNPVWVCVSSIRLTLVTTATVGNRQVMVFFNDAASVTFFRAAASAVQAASTSNAYSLGSGIPTSTVGSNQSIAIPSGLMLPPLSNITIADSANIDVNDNISGGVIILGYLA